MSAMYLYARDRATGEFLPVYIDQLGGGAGVGGGDGLTDAQLRASPLPVREAVGSPTSIGSQITAGGTAQVLVAANAARRGLLLQNTSTGDLRVNPWGTASATAGLRVVAGALLVLDAPHCGTGAVSIWGATTGQTFQGGQA